jgi:hypothetical protein
MDLSSVPDSKNKGPFDEQIGPQTEINLIGSLLNLDEDCDVKVVQPETNTDC